MLAGLAAGLATTGGIAVAPIMANSAGRGPTGLGRLGVAVYGGFLVGALAVGAVEWGLARRRTHA